jgi:outer membrane receptor for ferrienterochelin and colicins
MTCNRFTRWPGIEGGVLLVFALLANPAFGQTVCKERLGDAFDLYKTGLFDQAHMLVEECLKKGRPGREDKIDANRLLTMIFLASDDDRANATVKTLLEWDPNYAQRSDDPFRFTALVDRMKKELASQPITTSVSKVPENVLEAPATVVTVTADQISRRGYLDLEAVLHDLPGFDISRTNGQTYSNIYQRGYRSDGSNGMLLLVDGVEQNDLFSNVAYLSRQYPVSHVEKIEVIYGPASTMYGANAFLGVINVVTREPEKILEGSKRSGGQFQLGYGSWKTNYEEGQFAAKIGNATVSVSGRVYKSDEWDLSSYSNWDYNPQRYLNAENYKSTLFRGKFASDTLAAQPGLLQQAMSLDLAGLFTPVGGRSVGYSDLTDDRMLSVTVKFPTLTLGFQGWRAREGAASLGTDRVTPGAKNGEVWAPEHTALFAKFEGLLGDQVSFKYFGQAKVQALGPSSSIFRFRSYLDGPLDVNNLLGDTPRQPFWEQTLLTESSLQFRNEVDLTYRIREGLNLVGGFEIRNGSTQGEYIKSSNCQALGSPLPAMLGALGPGLTPTALANDFTGRPDLIAILEARVQVLSDSTLRLNLSDCVRSGDPQITGAAGGDHYAVVDQGYFTQLTYRPKPTSRLSFVGGLRSDEKSIMPDAGYTRVLSPRVAVIFAPHVNQTSTTAAPASQTSTTAAPVKWPIVKFVFSQGLKDASNAERYSTIPGQRERPNPYLSPEHATNYEFSVGRQWGTDARGGSLDVSVYRSSYDHVVTASPPQLSQDVFDFSNLYLTRFPQLDGIPTPAKIAFMNNWYNLNTPDPKDTGFLTQLLVDTPGTSQFQNHDGLKTWGVQAQASWRYEQTEVFGNYTHTKSTAIDENGIMSIMADIASHHVNVGASTRVDKTMGRLRFMDKIEGSLRFNFVGSRPVGPGTTTPLASVDGTPLTRIDSYLVANATVGRPLSKNLTVQFVLNNLFNAGYFDPGVGSADGVNFAARIPQPGRSAFVRLLLGRF